MSLTDWVLALAVVDGALLLLGAIGIIYAWIRVKRARKLALGAVSIHQEARKSWDLALSAQADANERLKQAIEEKQRAKVLLDANKALIRRLGARADN